MSPTNPGPPTPCTLLHTEVDSVRRAFARNRNDLGLGIYNPYTGEIRIGTFDTTGLRIGHDGLQMTVGFPDSERPQWRGFVFSSGGQVINQSGFNIPDGTPPRMRAVYFAEVQTALKQEGLI